MKTKLMTAITTAAILCVIILVSVQGCDCEDPIKRGGSLFDGSAKWAIQYAQPVADSFASDVQLYNILGAMIWKDGRLPSNTGSWSFVYWSPSLGKECQVTVNYLGNTSKSIREQVDPPASGLGGPIPTEWVNSTTVFASIPSQEITKSYALLVVFNLTNYPQASDEAAWGINFSGGNNPLVKWDGTYIGTQFE